LNTIGSINNSTITGRNTTTSSDQNVLGKDDFLTLLVSQLQNQDPLNPSDPTEFVSQLAQFSSLEQLMNVNGNLEAIQDYQNSLNRSMATSLFGKSIVATGNAFELEDGQPTSISFTLPETADSGTVNIYDSAGNFIFELEPEDWSAGEHSIEWDGTDGNGNSFSSGVYLFDVQAVDASGKSIEVETHIKGKVTGAKYIKGNVYLTLNEKIVPLSSVIEVIGASKKPKT
jgi:flagellar basal-body rod modification protein FlgD